MKKVPLTGSMILRVNDTSLSRRQGNAIEILNMVGHHYYIVRGLAAYFWLRLDGSMCVSELIQEAKKQFNITDKRFAEKSRMFFATLLSNNLVSPRKKRLEPSAHSRKWLEKKAIATDLALLKLDKIPTSTPVLTAAAGGST